MRHLAFLIAALMLSALLPTQVADARREEVHSYRYDQLWRSVIRMLRVDYGMTVHDRDEEIGYIMFDYQDGNRAYPGSVELVRFVDQGQDKVRVVVNIPAMPAYVERMLLERLTRKLRDDYGMPVTRSTRTTRDDGAEETDAAESETGEDENEEADSRE